MTTPESHINQNNGIWYTNVQANIIEILRENIGTQAHVEFRTYTINGRLKSIISITGTVVKILKGLEYMVVIRSSTGKQYIFRYGDIVDFTFC